MKTLLLILSLTMCSLLVACEANSTIAELPVQELDLSTGQAVYIEADSGAVDITSGGEAAVRLSGQGPTASADSVTVVNTSDGIHFSAKNDSRPFWEGGSPAVHLNVRVPNGTSVHVDSYEAAVNIHDFEGEANISTVAGDIRIQDSKGQFNVKDNRGSVAVVRSSGEIGLAGNYGLLSLQDTTGVMSAATILGMARFAGVVKAGDMLKLETDHGPVELQLADTTDATVTVSSTTGVVSCTVPGLQTTGAGCAGTLNNGDGQVIVQTVSGAVTVEPLR
ncbi:MAG TPA: DUF4097 family beta strand repeat-containing protein [Anaerolineales bacterium]|nr:DUF4097 family beta strand repeat-containing protein [Anaerolineales bacterium]